MIERICLHYRYLGISRFRNEMKHSEGDSERDRGRLILNSVYEFPVYVRYLYFDPLTLSWIRIV